jgi:RimJ/RimL family protein N-acetyltransferase
MKIPGEAALRFPGFEEPAVEYEIRTLAPEDGDAMYELVNRVKDEKKYLFYTLRFPAGGTGKYIESHNLAGNPVLGAFTPDGVLAGWIDFSVGSFEEVSHVGTIGMGVAAENRGRGLGQRLMRACIESARRLGLEKLELEVFATNAAARALYRKMGFVEEGRLRRKRKFEGAYDDLVCMALFLDEGGEK